MSSWKQWVSAGCLVAMLGAVVADANDRALATRERLAEMGHQLGLGQVT